MAKRMLQMRIDSAVFERVKAQADRLDRTLTWVFEQAVVVGLPSVEALGVSMPVSSAPEVKP